VNGDSVKKTPSNYDDDLVDFFIPGSGPKPLGQILKDMDLIRESHVQEALAIQREQASLIGEILVTLGHVTTAEVEAALAVQVGMDVVDLNGRAIPPEIIAIIDAQTARIHRVVPIALDGDTLTLAMADPLNYRTLDDLRFQLSLELKGAAADPEAVDQALDRYYPET
jgi:type IV pilus assembly protein PilB